MGATVEGIVLMFSKEYVKLLLIGFVIASFAAWFLMGKWLDSFAYKIDFGIWIYLSGLGVTMLIAVLTVGYRSYRAATADPVKSLRYE
jgi:ABC-type antimicrobial peptide transport system permease subunit